MNADAIIQGAHAMIAAALAVVAVAVAAVVVVGAIIGACKVAAAWLEEWRGRK